ncbi:MAG: carboxylating nicotinate-nucleotide diphosphorylase [Planctomycetota bacterium]
MEWSTYDRRLDDALREDHADQDITTDALIDVELECEAELVARQQGVVCGLQLAGRLVERMDGLCYDPELHDGDEVRRGATIASFRGRAADMLRVERTLLNFVQRLSGVATLTRRYVRAVEGSGTKIVDTRKTTPGWRELEKYAVRCGGGTNHRMGLHDMFLIKENHLRLFGGGSESASPDKAVEACRERGKAPVEVEVENLQELECSLRAMPDYVLLDNMSVEEVGEACRIRDESPASGTTALEASGGITLENVQEYARTGVERISVGALTHSAPALDISLNFV